MQKVKWIVLLKAIVVQLNDKIKDVGAVLAIARSEARKREQSDQNPIILAMPYVPELHVHVAVYEVVENQIQNVKHKG